MAVWCSGTCFGARLGLASAGREWAYGQHRWNYNTVLWCDKKLVRWRDEWRIYSWWFYSTHRNPKPRGTVFQNVFLCHGHAPRCRTGFEHTNHLTRPCFYSFSFVCFCCCFFCWCNTRSGGKEFHKCMRSHPSHFERPTNSVLWLKWHFIQW